MLTQAEMLPAPPAKDVDELGLVCAPFQLASFQQVLVEWGRWHSLTQGAALGTHPPFAGLNPDCPSATSPILPRYHLSQ